LESVVASICMVSSSTVVGVIEKCSVIDNIIPEKGTSQTSFSCMVVSSQTLMSAYPLTSSLWVFCVFQTLHQLNFILIL